MPQCRSWKPPRNTLQGAEIKITARLDVNADGAVDASDASAILLHAAQAGAGKLPNWVEIVQ